VALDSNNPAIYKQLYRAAKAKLKLRIKATVTQCPALAQAVPNIMDEQQPRAEPLRLPTPPKASPASRHSYLDTVLSTPRDQEKQPRQSDFASVPAVSAFVPGRPAPGMSFDNATSETLVTPAKLGQAKAAKKDTAAKTANLRHGQDLLSGAFCIDCNNCGKSIPDEHYHCGICDDGDFDLCSSCIAADVTCDGEGHWLIKRRIQNGLLVSSVTETIPPKKRQEEKSIENDKENTTNPQHAPRTCNSCINGTGWPVSRFVYFTDSRTEVPGGEMVTCNNCADYDLCMMCFSLGDHGHHPAHRFQPVCADISKISSRILSLCEAGRGLAHSAICDGCEKARKSPSVS
jgi:next to BRCA1 gene 1 protein